MADLKIRMVKGRESAPARTMKVPGSVLRIMNGPRR
jgi:hypothetical protein